VIRKALDQVSHRNTGTEIVTRNSPAGDKIHAAKQEEPFP
jgi:hypothetical protein